MPPIKFSNQSKKQVLSHMRANMVKTLKYHIHQKDHFIRVVEAANRRKKKTSFSKMMRVLSEMMGASCTYDMQIGSFRASCDIKIRMQKGRSDKGHCKEKLGKWRDKLPSKEVKKFATKKTTKPKIRSQKAGRRMVTLKGQPGCGN